MWHAIQIMKESTRYGKTLELLTEQNLAVSQNQHEKKKPDSVFFYSSDMNLGSQSLKS